MNNERNFSVETESQLEFLSKFVLRQSLPFQALLGPLRKKRSTSANARLWALHTLAAEHTGYSPEEMHEFALCRHFGFTEHDVIDFFTGEVVKKRIPLERSSTKDTKKFAAFMESTESWYGNDFAVWLPLERAA